MRHSGLEQCLRLLGLTLFRSRGTFARPTLKRVCVLSVFIPVLLILQVCHWVGFLLDEVFFRAYRAVSIRSPVFILGIPRSGTTFLHRVLSRDTHNFTTMQLWEMLLAPSITGRKVLMALGAVDRCLGGFGRRLLAALEARAFAGVRKIHRISFFEPEEDDLVLLPIFASIFLLFPFPFPEALWHLARFDEATPPSDRRRIMSFYRRCIQRHLYVHGPGKCFLSKNPAMTAKIDAIDAYFPDAKVVCNVREPFSAIPSLLSFLSFTWSRFDNDPRGCAFRDMVLDLAGHWYRHPWERLPGWPDSRRAIVYYDVLTGDPCATVSDLYAQFALEMTPGFARCLEEEREKSRRYKSEHTYSLDQYGLTSEDIVRQFGDVVARFDPTSIWP